MGRYTLPRVETKTVYPRVAELLTVLKRSVNCQAFSAALFVSLMRTDKASTALKSPDIFLEIAYSGPAGDGDELHLQETVGL